MVAAGGLFARRAHVLYRLVRAGKPASRFDDVPRRVEAEAVVVAAQSKLLQRLGPGLMHAAIFWGFIVLFPTIVIAMIGAVDPHATLPWLGSSAYAFLVDVFAVLVFAGVLAAFAIRKIQRPRRFSGSHLGEADLILVWIAGIVVSLIAWHSSQIALGYNDFPRGWAPVSNAVSNLWHGSWVQVLERVAVWAHVLLILAFLVYLPYSKHLHILVAAINVFFTRTRARGRLEPVDFDKPEAEVRLGAATAQDLTWKQLLDTMSCTECGRCQDACPAYTTGKELSPKLLIMALRDHARAQTKEPLVPNAVTDNVVWDCVTCGACIRECPVGIEHIDHIVDMRRNLVMLESRFPEEAGTMLRDVDRASNPWGRAPSDRMDWAGGLDVRVLAPGDPPPDVLFWVGCAPAFDERARQGARSTAKLLQAAGVDFAVLGPREACTGDPARRMGDEYTYQRLAKENVETLNTSKVTKIVTTCPHCFNTIGGEYPDFGGRYEVVHHTEFLAELVREGKLAAQPGERKITYHDSCYLARHNDVITAPRTLAAASGQTVEMARHGRRTFCCGAGGARMWMEERGRPINEERVREAASTGADTLAVACPFCTVMLDDGVRNAGAKLQVIDLASLLHEAVERKRSAEAGAE